MGMESFFISVLPEGVTPVKKNGLNTFEGHTTFKISELLNQLKKTVKIDSNNGQFVVAEAIKVTIGAEEGDYIREITLEGCLSWYKEGLKECYDLIKDIINVIGDIKVYHPSGLNFSLGSEEEFIQNISGYYDRKYDEFQKQFGPIHVKTLPDKSFYDIYQKSKRKGLLTKLFKQR